MSEAVRLEDAAQYARKHDLHALVIAHHGAIVYEEYGGGYDAHKAHALYSGAKSFWGIAALIAQSEGLLDLDEPVSHTIDRWRSDDRKSRVTLRQLLTLSAGIPFGGLGAGVPAFEKALEKELIAEPGSRFTYGGIPLQVFGAVLARKTGADPLAYLQKRIFEPAGMQFATWRALSDGTHTLPTGAFFTAGEWLKYGTWLLGKPELYAPAFAPCATNPRYGLGFWLDAGEPFAAYASGSGKQALYLLPAAGLAAVHFSASKSYRHEAFLLRLRKAL